MQNMTFEQTYAIPKKIFFHIERYVLCGDNCVDVSLDKYEVELSRNVNIMVAGRDRSPNYDFFKISSNNKRDVEKSSKRLGYLVKYGVDISQAAQITMGGKND